jgi:phosphoribosylformylglycinamidine cyclo-ligase
MFLSMAHITGGGLVENTRRAIPEGLDVEFNYTAWEVPSIFRSIQKLGEVEEESMWTTFNMGIGMVAIVAPDRAEFLMNDLFLYNPKIIGRLV